MEPLVLLRVGSVSVSIISSGDPGVVGKKGTLSELVWLIVGDDVITGFVWVGTPDFFLSSAFGGWTLSTFNLSNVTHSSSRLLSVNRKVENYFEAFIQKVSYGREWYLS